MSILHFCGYYFFYCTSRVMFETTYLKSINTFAILKMKIHQMLNYEFCYTGLITYVTDLKINT